MRRDSLVSLPPELTRPPPRSRRGLVLGVDGGATKTLAAVLDIDRGTIHVGRAGPSNEDAVGPKAAADAMMGAAEAALRAAGVRAAQIAAGVLAIAGTDTSSVERNVRAALSEPWIVVNDVVGAWATATGAGPGVAVISGTGSNVFGVGPEGTWRAGGWGHLLGDEGSGYWLGVQSIKAALRDREASGPQTALSGALVRFFGVDSVEALASLVYSKPLTAGELAAFAIETGRIAQEGDAVARGLYERGARELSEQVRAVIVRTGLQRSEFPVGLIGSAFKVGELFVGALSAAIRQAAPGARVEPVEMPPVAGSLLLAARACGRGQEVDAAELAALLEGALAAPSSSQPG